MKEIKFTVYGDPVSKARPRVVKGHTFTPARTREQEDKVALVYKSIYRDMVGHGEPLRMVVDMYVKIPKSTRKKDVERMLSGEIRPVKRILDADNGAKLVMDALNGIAYPDDAQIVEITGRKFYGTEPRTEIYISVVGNGE